MTSSKGSINRAFVTIVVILIVVTYLALFIIPVQIGSLTYTYGLGFIEFQLNEDGCQVQFDFEVTTPLGDFGAEFPISPLGEFESKEAIQNSIPVNDKLLIVFYDNSWPADKGYVLYQINLLTEQVDIELARNEQPPRFRFDKNGLSYLVNDELKVIEYSNGILWVDASNGQVTQLTISPTGTNNLNYDFKNCSYVFSSDSQSAIDTFETCLADTSRFVWGYVPAKFSGSSRFLGKIADVIWNTLLVVFFAICLIKFGIKDPKYLIPILIFICWWIIYIIICR